MAIVAPKLLLTAVILARLHASRAFSERTDGQALLAWRASWARVPDEYISGTNAWRAEALPCIQAWTGISCTTGPEGSRVTSIYFSGFPADGIVGTLSPALGNLTELREFIITYMPGIVGTLPRELGRLQKLEHLQLQALNLTGPLPAIGWSGMKSLKTLWVSESRLTGPLPPAAAMPPGIVQCNLEKNLLRGTVPRTWWQLQNLTLLYLNDNRLSGSFPPEYSQAPSLRRLRLARNRLVGPLPLALAPNLEWLDLSFNKFRGQLPRSWANTPAPPGQIFFFMVFLHDNPKLRGPVPKAWATGRFTSGNNYFHIKPNTKICGNVPMGASISFWDSDGRSVGLGMC